MDKKDMFDSYESEKQEVVLKGQTSRGEADKSHVLSMSLQGLLRT